MEEVINQLNIIIDELEWGIERGREIKLSKSQYKMILLLIKCYLELREEILENAEFAEQMRK